MLWCDRARLAFQGIGIQLCVGADSTELERYQDSGFAVEMVGQGMRLDSKAAFYEFFVDDKRISSYTPFYPKMKVDLCIEVIYQLEFVLRTF